MARASLPIAILIGLAASIVFLGVDIRLGVRIRVSDFVVVAVAPVVLFYVLRSGLTRRGVGFLVPFFVFVAYALANTAALTGPEVAAKELVQFALFTILFLATVRYVNGPAPTAAFITTFLLVLWILALWNAAHHLALGQMAGWKMLGDQKLTHSVVLVSMLSILGLAHPVARRVMLILLPIALLFLILSGERKGWVAAGLGAAVGAFWLSTPRFGAIVSPRTLIAMMIVMAGTAAVWGLAPHVPYIEKQLGSIGEFASLVFGGGASPEETTLSNRGRILAIEIAMDQFRQHPVFGIGNENYIKTVRSMAIDDSLQKAAHNELLRIAAELGTVGLVLHGLVNVSVALRLCWIRVHRAALSDDQRLRAQLGAGFFVYGFIVNVFLAGGGLNTYFLVMPAALVFSVPLPVPDPVHRQRMPYGWTTA